MIETFHEFKKENNVFEFMLIRIPAYYKKISCNELRKKIKDHGQIPAPITPQTKMLYVKKKLWKLDQGVRKCAEKDSSPVSLYPVEIK